MAVPFLLPPVIENLNSLLHNKVALLSGVDKEMKKLSSTLSTIHAVLEDAEQKQLQDKAIHTWLSVQPKHSNANLKAKDPPLLLSRGSLLAELKCLNVGGELCIKHLERVRNPMDAKEANLAGKQNLSWRELNWEYSLAESESENDESESQEIDEAESQEIDEFESSENVEFKNIVNVLMVAAARIEVVVASEALSAGRFWAVHGFEAN
ncbi:putative disease resistance protein RGA4 [Camellia lanceoleosa]|uniref:Disease resistance protein RGA4 n=1 Tax=Camellia lanceoleosa TaxID=1840588 RepID=A0ACC0FPQ2_9ERIC|nr:putative disease resistance protein RGA4 [Camellia lanceoleosa]